MSKQIKERVIQKLEGPGWWVPVKMKDIKKGNTFRLSDDFEGTRLWSYFTATEDGVDGTPESVMADRLTQQQVDALQDSHHQV